LAAGATIFIVLVILSTTGYAGGGTNYTQFRTLNGIVNWLIKNTL